ncbi:CRISPR system Cascade subunit CasB [Psychromicrobium silvestre]|uniref:CRISPR system Cascade subunit CasB n=1 Tax=Psychromicrobium silvestre TaxID=1645614 RepID=A0A7Y9LUC0_9MICC|nr:type I-E CRISPR-associated protein Cse2/CasB [Psychromicrobium silvestre]NYE95731.1 CRISPR system Cascade subunit CasB [Psychromicrobium silvestre]
MSDIEESNTARLKRVVRARVEELQEGYLRDRSSAVAALAQLRHGVAKPIGDDPLLIGLTVADLYEEGDNVRSEPSYAEKAAYAAITLYAVHQQSKRDPSKRDPRMHQAGNSFGRSAGLLWIRPGDEKAVRRRFEALATASTLEGSLHHARGLIQQFRSKDIPLDYVKFAEDLYWLQTSAANRVRRRWGIDFYRAAQSHEQGTGDDAEKN